MIHPNDENRNQMKIHTYVGAFLQENNKFLFGKRSSKKTWAPRQWDIVGGKALKDEHPYYALRRECREEIAVKVMNAELMTTLLLKDDAGKEFTYMIYMITAFKGKPVNCSPEHLRIAWFTLDELTSKSLALPEYVVMLEEWMKKD